MTLFGFYPGVELNIQNNQLFQINSKGEDIIGGELPCRFKYRDVIPNDFGLEIDEVRKFTGEFLDCMNKLTLLYKLKRF